MDDCTVDGSTHSSITPVHSAGVSRPGAAACAAMPSTGNSTKVDSSTSTCSFQCRAPASASHGASLAPCRKNSSAIAALVAYPAATSPAPCTGSTVASATMPTIAAI